MQGSFFNGFKTLCCCITVGIFLNIKARGSLGAGGIIYIVLEPSVAVLDICLYPMLRGLARSDPK